MAGDTSSLRVRTPSNDFGLLIPRETGVEFRHQSGGMMCKQIDMEGVFIQLDRPQLRQGYPDWKPDTSGGIDPDEPHPITEVDLETQIPDRDYESLPEWVKERGHFYNWDEFMHWVERDEVWWHWTLDLVEELRKYHYDPDASMAHTERDMTKKWDSAGEIWDAINERLPFTYEEYDPWAERQAAVKAGNDPNEVETPIPEGYPEYEAAMKWIKITGSKYYDGKPKAKWAEDLAGEYVILCYPNVD